MKAKQCLISMPIFNVKMGEIETQEEKNYVSWRVASVLRYSPKMMTNTIGQ
jgi:hypothetical protein